MSKINLSSVMSKVSRQIKSKGVQKRVTDKIEEYRKSGIEKTCGGGVVITIEDMCMIAEEMIKTLMKGMGRTPNQKQVNQLMKQMNKFN